MSYYPNQQPGNMGYTPQPVPIMNSANNFNSGRQPYPPPPMVPVNPPATYGQPVVTAAIVVNQVPAMTVMANTSSSFATTCPFCKAGITTTSIQTCNCMACILCYFTGCIFYFCFQLCRGKDFCCYDAVHTCPQCGNTIAQYTAC